MSAIVPVAQATPGRPGLFVLSTPRPADTVEFYRRVTGWELQPARPGSMGLLGQVARDPAEQTFVVREGVGGWLPFLSVDALGPLLERAAATGGRVVFPLPDDDSGRAAIVLDPSGPRLGLVEVDVAAGPPRLEPGAAVWVEEKTRDQDAATAFHAEVFGFTVLGPRGPGNVRLLRRPEGSAYGGVMQLDDRYPPDQAPFWLVYMSTDDVDATLELAVRHGGSVWFPPVATPLGRLAYLRDPAGNALAVVEVAAAAHALLGAPDTVVAGGRL